MAYHINSSGEVRVCQAQHGRCPFGSEDDHYPTAAIARTVYEMNMGEYGVPAHKKTRPIQDAQQLLEEARLADPLPYHEWHEEDLPASRGFAPARAGLKPWVKLDLEVPHQADTFWEQFDEVVVDTTMTTFRTTQERVRYGGVRHYLTAPDQPLDEYTEEEGVAVRAMVIDGDIYIQEGNHRTAAALIAKRPLRMKLAPEHAVQAYWREQIALARARTK